MTFSHILLELLLGSVCHRDVVDVDKTLIVWVISRLFVIILSGPLFISLHVLIESIFLMGIHQLFVHLVLLGL